MSSDYGSTIAKKNGIAKEPDAIKFLKIFAEKYNCSIDYWSEKNIYDIDIIITDNITNRKYEADIKTPYGVNKNSGNLSVSNYKKIMKKFFLMETLAMKTSMKKWPQFL